MLGTTGIELTVPVVHVRNHWHCEFWIFKILNWFKILNSNFTVFKFKFTSILMVSSANTAFISVFKFEIQNWFIVFKFKLKFRYNFTYMMRTQFEVHHQNSNT